MKICEYGVYNPEIDEVEPCGNICEGTTDRCASHNAFFRKLEKQNIKASEKRAQLLSKPKQVRKRVRPVSEKREGQNREYSLLKPKFLQEHPNCEVKLTGCEGASVDVHHTASGSNKVANLNNVSTWKATCAHCHRILHDKLSAKEARELGLKI